MSSSACTTRDGSRRSTMHLASCLQIRISRSACANSSTPPSEVNRPPSNAAVTFLRPTAGNPIRAALSSRTAGVACGILCLAAELVSTPSFLQKVSALSHSRQPIGTLWCIREASVRSLPIRRLAMAVSRLGQSNLTFGGRPEFLGRAPQHGGKDGDRNAGNGRHKPILVIKKVERPQVCGRYDTLSASLIFKILVGVGEIRGRLLERNYPPPCQGGSVVIHPVHESRGTRRAYEAGIGRVGATAAAP